MRSALSVIGLLLLAIALGHVAHARQDRAKPSQAPKKKAAQDLPEKSEVEYESKTHGALQVKSASKNPSDFFDVRQNGKRSFSGSEPLLDSTLQLLPGAYIVFVNRTERKVNIEAGKKTILLTGDLMVQSKREGRFWVPKQGNETRLAQNPPIVNSRVALFPGKYNAYVNVGPGTELKNLGGVEVKAGKTTVVKN